MAEHICPHCKKPNYDDDALLCLYCGESLNRGNKYFLPHAAVIIIIVILLWGFISWIIR